MLELARAVAAERDLPHLFRLATRAALSFAGADDALVFAPLELRASHRRHETDPELVAQARELVLGTLRARVPVSEACVVTARGAHLAAVPIQAGERPLGGLVAVRSRDGANAGPFDPSQLACLRGLADLLALALQGSELLAEQQHRVRELSLLSEVAAECTELGLDQLLPSVTQHFLRALSAGLAATFFVDEGGEALVAGAVCASGGALTGVPGRFTLGAGLAARALNAREARRGHVTELGLAEFEAIARDLGLTQCTLVPLVQQGRSIGLVCTASANRKATDDELRLATALAAEVTVAVENTRLFGETQRRAADLELVRGVGQVIARSLETSDILREATLKLAEVVEVDVVRVYLKEGEVFRAAIDMGTPEMKLLSKTMTAANPVIAMALAAREPVAAIASELPDPSRSFCMMAGFTRLAAAALRAVNDQGESVDLGVVVLARKAARSFSPSELRVLAAVVSQLAVALENGRLYETMRRSVEDLSIVTEAGRALIGDVSLAESLDSVAQKLARSFGLRGGMVLLHDEAARALTVAGIGPGFLPQTRDQLRIPVDAEKSAAAIAFRERRALHRLSIEEPANRAHALRLLGWVPSWGFAVPLIAGNLVVGALLLLDDERSSMLSDAEVARAVAICQQIGFVVERARLNARLEQSLVELAAAQDQLVRRERLAALGELAALVAHEVRNPLGAIVTSLGALSKLVDLQGDARRVYDIMGEEAQRLNGIVDGILDYTRPVSVHRSQVPVDRLLREAVSSARAGELNRGTPVDRVEVRIESDAAAGELSVDERLVHQALVNLLSNALQSLAVRGGVVRLSARRASAEAGETIRIVVSDDGPGIAPELVERLFEPFFTTKAKGSGLGLAVVKRIVEAHAGDIRVVTGAGRGTSFELVLPAAGRSGAMPVA